MKVMYFAFEGFDSPNGTNHLAEKIMKEILNAGHEVYMLNSHSLGLAPDVPDSLKDHPGFCCDIVSRKSVAKNNFTARYFDGVFYAFRCMKKWYKHRGKIDVVILQSSPTVVFSSILLALFMRKPVVFNSYDIFPDGPYLHKAINDGLTFRMLHALQSLVYRYSCKIIAISEDMYSYLKMLGVSQDKLMVIPNWYDDTVVCSIKESDNAFLNKYNLDPERFYIQYAGNFGYTFDHEMVLNVAELLKDNQNICFQMIGSGAFEKVFKEKAQARGLTNIDFYPWQPLGIISDVYSACSIGFIPLNRGVIYTSFPSKSALLMACGRTVVCTVNKDSAYYHIVNSHKIGICVDRDPVEASQAILYLYENPGVLAEMKSAAKQYALDNYSSTHNVQKIIDVLVDINRRHNCA